MKINFDQIVAFGLFISVFGSVYLKSVLTSRTLPNLEAVLSIIVSGMTFSCGVEVAWRIPQNADTLTDVGVSMIAVACLLWFSLKSVILAIKRYGETVRD